MKMKNVLKRARQERSYSQEEVAGALGVAVTTISRWENGHVELRAYYRRRLAALYEKKPGELFPALMAGKMIDLSPEEQQPEGQGEHRNYLRRERRLRNWSQEDLAQKVGAARGSISRWEQGYVLPNRHYMWEFCRVFGMRRRDLFPSLEARQKQSTTLASASVDRSGREADAESRKSVVSMPVEGVATLEEEAYRLQLEERRIEGLRTELDLQRQSLANAQGIACQVLQWIYPDLDEELVLAMAQQIPLKGEEQEQSRLRRVIEASARSRDGAVELPAENIAPLFRERGAGGA
ncbi:helix-turn-helix transcriptional regulator [Ktedonobacter racemifer]|uniref:Transcriptional regulator, XRE family n=1 Tax=Ktedonobacter racemifer DSM 44963 TaxID=485913 RepID=D6TBB1_KTERA|nr:helix-turn-helix domain-containing protein [Ktedonobacter racemifer]EFH87895.1 transcriptional regulator, XRE family [Ktedonobacter racemifer DSM 44963]